MCDFVADGDAAKFVCAAGVLTHYIGDACQPLHISYLHDGEKIPLRIPSLREKSRPKRRAPQRNGRPSAYEGKMIFDHRKLILEGLQKTRAVKKSELIGSGREAAKLTIDLMRNTFKLLPPRQIVNAYVKVGKGAKLPRMRCGQNSEARLFKSCKTART
jgi:hypothetical protein